MPFSGVKSSNSMIVFNNKMMLRRQTFASLPSTKVSMFAKRCVSNSEISEKSKQTSKPSEVNTAPPNIFQKPSSKSPLTEKKPVPRVAVVSNFNQSDEPLPKLVVIGGGWGSTYFLKGLKPFTYNTTLISTKNYFLYTPLLPETSSGTLEPNCIVEPSRTICKKSMSYFVEANVNDIDFGKKLISAESITGEPIAIPYDFLVISTGAVVNTFGIPGVDKYAVTLKTIDDSIKIRSKVLSAFEKANISKFPEEKRRLLTFVVCGAGPTGVECIGELRDLLYNDLVHYYPQLVKDYAKLILIEGANRVLLAMKPENSQKSLEHLKSIDIDVRLNTLVSQITEDTVVCKTIDPASKETKIQSIEYGACIWSGGVGPSPLTKTLCDKLYPNIRKRGLVVDNDLSLRGINDVFAIGDCATFEGPTLSNLFEKHLGEAKNLPISYSLFKKVFKKVANELPYKLIHPSTIKDIFNSYDSDKNSKIESGELEKLCSAMNLRMTALAPTAQVASQQGMYLQDKFNKAISTYSGKEWQLNSKSNEPFKYDHNGVFAYLGGGKSILELDGGRTINGRLGFYIWKLVYLGKQINLSKTYSVLLQWIKSAYFGRNVAHY